MAEEQKKKKVSAKGRKVKKGSPARRSFFFKPATIILSLLATLLFVLGMIYLARVQHWFPSATFTTTTKNEEHKPPVAKPLKGKVVSEEKGKDGLAESSINPPPAGSVKITILSLVKRGRSWPLLLMISVRIWR